MQTTREEFNENAFFGNEETEINGFRAKRLRDQSAISEIQPVFSTPASRLLPITQPKEIATPLLSHQLTGYRWMNDRETRAYGISAGFVFDVPGLGKTLMTIAAILSNPVPTTLIICPPSVVPIWEQEFLKHAAPKNDYLLFTRNGKNRDRWYRTMHETLRIIDIARNEEGTKGLIPIIVVIGLSELRENPLFFPQFDFTWDRVIFDEAHNLRNPHTLMFQHSLKIRRSFTWCLTGTPIVNEFEKEMIILFKVAGIIAHKNEIWPLISRITNMDYHRLIYFKDFMKINTVLRLIAMRRVAITDRPSSEHQEFTIRLQPTQLEREFQSIFNGYEIDNLRILLQKIQADTADPIYLDENAINERRRRQMNTFVSLLRLRQACVLPALSMRKMLVNLPLSVRNYLASPVDTSFVTPQILDRLRAVFNPDSVEEDRQCAVCIEATADCTAIPCGHCLCMGCWANLIRCPFCRGNIDRILFIRNVLDSVDHPRQPVEETEQPLEIPVDRLIRPFWKSSKVECLKRIILETLGARGDSKIVVASQWVEVLDELRKILGDEFPDVGILQIDGRLPPLRRFGIIQQFQTDSTSRILMLSMLASGEGISLDAASTIVFMDRWWNAYRTIQTWKRIDRISQKHDVKIYHLHLEGTIEDHIEFLSI